MTDNKFNELIKVSNPIMVKRNADNLFGKNEYELDISDRKNKKYKIRFIHNGELTNWINFGDIRYSDYTKHNDENRRNNFRNRNVRWVNDDMNKPSFLSYHLLW